MLYASLFLVGLGLVSARLGYLVLCEVGSRGAYLGSALLALMGAYALLFGILGTLEALR